MTLGPADDRARVSRMLAGDEAAFEEFFADSFPPLFRFANARMRDAAAAEEVVQATLCRAVSRLSTYRGEARLFTWLCTFCRHEISAWYERRARRAPEVDLVDELPEVRAALESLGTDAGPEATLRRDELRRFVQAILDSLPGRHGDALEWKYIEGLTVAEIAARLGVGEKAAESVLSRARQGFREAITAAGGAAAWTPSEVR
jgi:RNA polymerase sigma-70 factor (ECF subfamily)